VWLLIDTVSKLVSIYLLTETYVLKSFVTGVTEGVPPPFLQIGRILEMFGATEEEHKNMAMTPMPQTTEDKIMKASNLKDEGNSLFKGGQYKKAISKYLRVFLFTKGLPGRTGGNPADFMLSPFGASAPSTEDLPQEVEIAVLALEAAAHSNIAQCHLKLLNAEKTIEHCQEALRINPNLWKVHWREATARSTIMKDHEGAIRCLDKALSCVDGDDETNRANLSKARAKAVTEFEKEEAKAYKKQASVFKQAFSKLAAEE